MEELGVWFYLYPPELPGESVPCFPDRKMDAVLKNGMVVPVWKGQKKRVKDDDGI